MKIEGEAIQVSSNEHRLEDFFREVEFDYSTMAMLLVFCLGSKGKIRLCIDRTEWDFGNRQINILMVIACYGERQVPLYWELLDNQSGNSGAADRINLLEKIISLVGVERIGILIADREFIGQKWLKYLKNQGINFCIRVPKNHLIERADGQVQSAEALLASRNPDQPLYLRQCLVDKVWVNVYLKKLEGDDILYLIGTMSDPKHLGQVYRRRWTIETVFQAFKSRGFDLESTHVKHLDRLKKLLGLVAMAYAFCLNLGIHYHQKIQTIKIKKNGYKEKSFCRVGIDWLKDLTKSSVQFFENTLYKFIRFLIFQKQNYYKNPIKPSLSGD
jgi:hypothetical protein